MPLARVAGKIFNRGHMITEIAAVELIKGIEHRFVDAAPPEPQASAYVDRVRDGRKPYEVTPESIAIIDVEGPLVNKAGWMEAACGMSSYKQIEYNLTDAITDGRIRGVLMRFDSPGGECSGAFELAQKIYQARAAKPIYAVCDANAFSAACLLATACERVFMPITGGIGSIGVIAQMFNQAEFDAKMGLKFITLYAGARKADFNPHEPTTKEAVAGLQSEIDRLYGMFCESVAQFRGMTVAAVKKTEAGLFWGPGGIEAGLADEVGGEEEALDALLMAIEANPAPVTGRLRAASTAPATAGVDVQKNRIEVESANIAHAAITTAKIQNLAITNATIANNAITEQTISGEAASAQPNPEAVAEGVIEPKGEPIMENETADAKTTAANNETEAVIRDAETKLAPAKSPDATADDVVQLLSIAGMPEKAMEVLTLMRDQKMTVKDLQAHVMGLKAATETQGIKSHLPAATGTTLALYQRAEADAERMAAERGISREAALDKVLAANPKAYEAYLAAHPQQCAART